MKLKTFQMFNSKIESNILRKFVPIEFPNYSKFMEFNGHLRSYPTFVPNKKHPIHNWFHYSQGFSKQLVEYCINSFSKKPSMVLDPFCGVGTTPITCYENGIKSVGLDISPLAVFISNAKLTLPHNIDSLRKDFQKIRINGRKPKLDLIKMELFKRSFSEENLDKILRLRQSICEIENTLSSYNSKTCDLQKFKKYIEEKNKVNNKLFNLYENEKFRQYKWYAYINKKRTEDNMNNLIKKKFGKNLNIIYGNWSVKKQMRNFISTPNLGVKRKLKEKFNIFNIDEYRTSCLHYKTEERGNNFYQIDKINKQRKLHSVLTFQMENTENESIYRIDCINRDYNGCLNIRKIFHSYMKNETRPQRYCRGFDYQKLPIPEKASSGSRLERRKGISSESAFIRNICS